MRGYRPDPEPLYEAGPPGYGARGSVAGRAGGLAQQAAQMDLGGNRRESGRAIPLGVLFSDCCAPTATPVDNMSVLSVANAFLFERRGDREALSQILNEQLPELVLSIIEELEAR